MAQKSMVATTTIPSSDPAKNVFSVIGALQIFRCDAFAHIILYNSMQLLVEDGRDFPALRGPHQVGFYVRIKLGKEQRTTSHRKVAMFHQALKDL